MIATPGRLWGLLNDQASDYLTRSVSKALQYLVVDEADKMLQSKHFQEMGDILERIRHRRGPSHIACRTSAPGRVGSDPQRG